MEPEQMLQDEIEHPELTQQLQHIYTPSLDNQRSLARIRSRLLAGQPAGSYSSIHSQTPFAPPFEQPVVGQFTQPFPTQPVGRQRKPLRYWRIVALVAVLVIIVFSGTLYALTHNVNSPARPAIRPQSTPTPADSKQPFLNSIQMTSTTTGWGLGTSTADNLSEIVRTTNGGQTWQEFNFDGQPAGLIGHFFLDDQTAWVLLGAGSDGHTGITVKSTVDGGKHWTTLTLPPGVSNITFVDQQHGWAWEALPIENVLETQALYKTIDGGKTWTQIGTTNTDRAIDDTTPGPLPFHTGGMSLTFVTPQRGWAAVSLSQDYMRSLLYITQDGGTTWQLQQLPEPVTGPIPGIHTTTQARVVQGTTDYILETGMSPPKFLTPQQGVLAVFSQASLQSPIEFYLYTTNDGGQTWSPQAARLENTNGSQMVREVIDTTHIVLANVNTNTIMVYALVDGQWQQQSTTRVDSIALVFFINDLSGWYLGEKHSGGKIINTLYATTDGGKTWHNVMRFITDLPANRGGG